MSIRTHPTQACAATTPAVARSSPETHHPRPTCPPELQRRVTISTATEVQQSPVWPHYVPADTLLNNQSVAQSTEIRVVETAETGIQRLPSAPAVTSRPPPSSTVIHPVLSVRSALRGHSRMHLAWDIRYSPDTFAPPSTTRTTSAPRNHRYSTGTLSTATTRLHTRSRSDTHAHPNLEPDLEPASAMNARLHYNYNSYPTSSSSSVELSPGLVFANHPIASEPATTPPRECMFILCRDLLPWLIPIYARNAEVGCTVLDVVRGVYASLQTPVEPVAYMRSAGAQDGTVNRRVDWLLNKTLFVCLERDKALASRRLPGQEKIWSEVFVLILAQR